MADSFVFLSWTVFGVIRYSPCFWSNMKQTWWSDFCFQTELNSYFNRQNRALNESLQRCGSLFLVLLHGTQQNNSFYYFCNSTWISWVANDIFCLLLSLCILKSFGGQHSREQGNAEAYPLRSMERLPQPSWQEEGRKLPRGAEECWQHLLVQCSYTGGITIQAWWYFIWWILYIIFKCS